MVQHGLQRNPRRSGRGGRRRRRGKWRRRWGNRYRYGDGFGELFRRPQPVKRLLHGQHLLAVVRVVQMGRRRWRGKRHNQFFVHVAVALVQIVQVVQISVEQFVFVHVVIVVVSESAVYLLLAVFANCG